MPDPLVNLGDPRGILFSVGLNVLLGYPCNQYTCQEALMPNGLYSYPEVFVPEGC